MNEELRPVLGQSALKGNQRTSAPVHVSAKDFFENGPVVGLLLLLSPCVRALTVAFLP